MRGLQKEKRGGQSAAGAEAGGKESQVVNHCKRKVQSGGKKKGLKGHFLQYRGGGFRHFGQRFLLTDVVGGEDGATLAQDT